ncbi:hypothetical protein VTO42DRAFT_714 [Malbranchea cinnamomea]
MPPPPSQRDDIEQVTPVAVKGFFTGAVRFGALSLLAHLILSMPHPMTFDGGASPPSPSQSSSSSSPSSSAASASGAASSPAPRHPALARTLRGARGLLLYRPLASLSLSLAPTSRVYRGLTPQFKVFLQIAAMTLGGCVWAERRLHEYAELMRRVKRAERRREEL